MVNAIKLTKTNIFKVVTFIESEKPILNCDKALEAWEDYGKIVVSEGIEIPFAGGKHIARIGDYIVKQMSGQIFPCSPKAFAEIYNYIDLEEFCEHAKAHRENK